MPSMILSECNYEEETSKKDQSDQQQETIVEKERGTKAFESFPNQVEKVNFLQNLLSNIYDDISG